MADVNWLLSTLVQSTAALVAIIGGMLVSRVVSIGAERSGLRRHVDELRASLAHQEGVQQEREDDVARAYADALWWAGRKTAMKAHGNIKPEALVDEWGWDPGAFGLETYIKPKIDRLSAAFAWVEAKLSEGGAYSLSRPERLHEDAAPGLAKVLGDVVAQLRDERPKRDRYGLASDGRIVAPIGSRERDRHDRAVEAAERAQEAATDRRREIEAALNTAVAQLDAAAEPVRIGTPLFVLGYISVVGLVVPLVVMSFSSTSLPAAGRGGLVALFVTGLAIFFWYIHTSARR